MAIATLNCRAQVGLAAPPVQVETHIGSGLPSFSIVGLAATAVKESKERVRSAIASSGFEFPAGRITVNLAPADLPKEGGRFDLPIALGVLLASGQLEAQGVDDCEFYGELSLNGELRAVRGLLPTALQARDAGRRLVTPLANAREIARFDCAVAHGACDLIAVCRFVAGANDALQVALADAQSTPPGPSATVSLADVRGQAIAKQALLIAATGGHSLLLCGAPGAGKSMLAERLPVLLPALGEGEAREVALINSVAGLEPPAGRGRPFRNPHHSASASAIVGGGPRALPGEISLAHHGVLFLDELPEFDRRVLEALREPLERGTVSIARAALRAVYPARFQLIAAMNPCPCGYHGDTQRRCRCSAAQLARYAARLSGPLLDRIDMSVWVQVPVDDELFQTNATPSTPDSSLREQIKNARELQWHRQGCLNAALDVTQLAEHAPLGRDCLQLLRRSRAKLRYSARSLHRILRVARSVADLAGENVLAAAHIAAALQLRRAFLPAQAEGGTDAASAPSPPESRQSP
ncbi:MAG: YifB family Mg chelatase-like AAA ATPase [Steroidobacteraceae bacterium]